MLLHSFDNKLLKATDMKKITLPEYRKFLITALCSYIFLLATSVCAQQKIEMPLWPDGAPNTNEITEAEKVIQNGIVGNVTQPSLTIYLPEKSNGKAVIACPGGGYAYVALKHEGHDMASWFNEQGITFAVLKYRMPNGHSDVPLSDAQKAIRIMRQHADEWNLKKIGIMGASAGGHLASTAATHYTKDCRPDFQLLLYPVISMRQEITHQGSRQNLLGKNPSDEQIEFFSNELQVNAQTPPALLIHCSDDRAVVPENSIRYYQALLAHKVPATLLCYPKGGHGWGFSNKFAFKKIWLEEVRKWLEML